MLQKHIVCFLHHAECVTVVLRKVLLTQIVHACMQVYNIVKLASTSVPIYTLHVIDCVLSKHIATTKLACMLSEVHGI